MKKGAKIYLAGKIPKGSEIETSVDWRQAYITELATVSEFTFLSPENPALDESDPLMVFGHDCSLVLQCDILVVDATTKLGVGTAQEMVIAKYFQKHVYTMLPKDTHHRRSNLRMHDNVVTDWIHPFIFAFSDHIFASLDEMVRFIRSKGEGLLEETPAGLEIIGRSIARYEGSIEMAESAKSGSCRPKVLGGKVE